MTGVDDIKARLTAATDGPWETDAGGFSAVWSPCGHNIADTGPSRDFSHGSTVSGANTEFIANAPTDIAYLLLLVEELECELDIADSVTRGARITRAYEQAHKRAEEKQ